jgi:hypothetical protein
VLKRPAELASREDRSTVYGTVFSGSPGGGYKPPGVMPSSLPRVYLFGGRLEPLFLFREMPVSHLPGIVQGCSESAIEVR